MIVLRPHFFTASDFSRVLVERTVTSQVRHALDESRFPFHLFFQFSLAYQSLPARVVSLGLRPKRAGASGFALAAIQHAQLADDPDDCRCFPSSTGTLLVAAWPLRQNLARLWERGVMADSINAQPFHPAPSEHPEHFRINIHPFCLN